MTTWAEAQAAEVAWWGTCTNTFDEEAMQLVAAQRMGLKVLPGSVIEADGFIVDIGGGPVSLLLKTRGWSDAVIVDPASFPRWVRERYRAANIRVLEGTGEDYVATTDHRPDEVWIYNTLQHVVDPGAVVEGACRIAPVVRVFEWIEFELNECHIHSLLASEIERWGRNAGGVEVDGAVESIVWNGGRNLSYHGVFRRDV